MKKIKAVIFDLDDTLYLESDYVISGFRTVAKLLVSRLKKSEEAVITELISLYEENKLNVLDRFLESYRLNEKGLVEKCIGVFRNHYPTIKLRSGTKELLGWLKNEKYKIGMITDGRPEGQWNKIRALNLEGFFNYIIVTDELGGIGYRKPSSVSYIQMMEQLEVSSEESVYIGDNPQKDFIAANKLGMETIMIYNEQGVYKQLGDPEHMARQSMSSFDEIRIWLGGQKVDQ